MLSRPPTAHPPDGFDRASLERVRAQPAPRGAKARARALARALRRAHPPPAGAVARRARNNAAAGSAKTCSTPVPLHRKARGHAAPAALSHSCEWSPNGIQQKSAVHTTSDPRPGADRAPPETTYPLHARAGRPHRQPTRSSVARRFQHRVLDTSPTQAVCAWPVPDLVLDLRIAFERPRHSRAPHCSPGRLSGRRNLTSRISSSLKPERKHPSKEASTPRCQPCRGDHPIRPAGA